MKRKGEKKSKHFKTIKAEVRRAYVAIRKLRLPGLRFVGKNLKQKKKKKIK